MLKVRSGCVVSPVENNHPLLSVIPCSLANAALNAKCENTEGTNLISALVKRWSAREVVIEEDCRSSLRAVLDILDVRDAEDEVAVFTTSGMPYLSGCVTHSIELGGSIRRESVSRQTKAILLVHEFGYPIEDIAKYFEYGLPVIEDIAFSFNSKFSNGNPVGTRGDYVVSSFSKYFNIQVGGAAARRNPELPHLAPQENSDTINYIQRVVDSQYSMVSSFSDARLNLLSYFTRRFDELGCVPYFNNTSRAIPGVFLFRAPAHWDLPRLKAHLWSIGVQCTVYYGDQAFYLPLHHNMTEGIVDYLFSLVASFIDET